MQLPSKRKDFLSVVPEAGQWIAQIQHTIDSYALKNGVLMTRFAPEFAEMTQRIEAMFTSGQGVLTDLKAVGQLIPEICDIYVGIAEAPNVDQEQFVTDAVWIIFHTFDVGLDGKQHRIQLPFESWLCRMGLTAAPTDIERFLINEAVSLTWDVVQKVTSAKAQSTPNIISKDVRQRFAFVTGRNLYAIPGNDLHGCVEDMVDVYNLLTQQYKFPQANVRALSDTRATADAILDYFKWLCSQPNAEVVFYNSSHGSQMQYREGGAHSDLTGVLEDVIIPYDIQDDFSNALAAEDFGKIIQQYLPDSSFLTFLSDSCLAGNTKVPLFNGTEKTMKQLSKEKGKYWVYSSKANGEIVPGLAHSARKMGTKKVIKVILDNDAVIECTDDHLFMLRDGTYRKSGELKEGDSLMPLYRRIGTDKYDKGYEMIHTITPKGRWKWKLTHHVLRDCLGLREMGSDKTVCHHRDFNKRNNVPENIEMLSWYDHRRAHGALSKISIRKLWKNKEFLAYRNSEEYRKDQSKCVTKCWQDAAYRKKYEEGVAKRMKEYGLPEKFIAYNFSEANRENSRRKAHKQWHIDRGIVKESCACCMNNHKVKRIERTNRLIDVYDLTVDEHHNFALSAGVFVHNCHSGHMTRDGIHLGGPGLGAGAKAKSAMRFMPAPTCIQLRSANQPNLIRQRVLGLSTDGVTGDPTYGGKVCLISGCQDDQTSEECVLGDSVRGAFTFNFTQIVREKILPRSMPGVIPQILQTADDVEAALSQAGFDQKPNLLLKVDRPLFGGI